MTKKQTEAEAILECQKVVDNFKKTLIEQGYSKEDATLKAEQLLLKVQRNI